jgi:hypothetical protein
MSAQHFPASETPTVQDCSQSKKAWASPHIQFGSIADVAAPLGPRLLAPESRHFCAFMSHALVRLFFVANIGFESGLAGAI